MLKIEIDIKRKEENKMKKWLSVLLAAVMLLAMAGIAGAENLPLTGKIEVDQLDPNVTVTAYQLIETTYDDGQITGMKWVSGMEEWLENNYKGLTVEQFAAYTSGELDVFYDKLAKSISALGLTKYSGSSGDGGNAVTLDNVAVGNYVVLVTNAVNVYRPMAASVQYTFDEKQQGWTVVNGKASAKKSTPNLDKKINEGKNTQAQKDAANKEYYEQTYDTVKIGDIVTFDIYADVPTYPAESINHTFVIGDVQAAGLTYMENSIKVMDEKGDALQADQYTVTEKCKIDTEKGQVDGIFKVEFHTEKLGNIKKVHIQYNAVVNENVEIGTDNNKNTAHLKYSRDPYKEKDYGYKEDEVKVYTYGIRVIKYTEGEGGRKYLKGAEFRLYEDKEAKTEIAVVKTDVEGVYRVATKDESTNSVVMVTAGEDGKIQIKGLKEGTYYLKETKAPAGGYNKLKDVVEIVIKKTKANDPKAVEKAASVELGECGSVKTEVLNNKGTILPSTGGMGTTVFMVAGIGVMACAVAALMLVLKRQKKNEG